jgi:short-subunit dehydrogenase
MSNQQTVLITGATSGIGFEFAKQFHAKGYNLILSSRSTENLDRVKKLLNNNTSTIDCFQSDLSQTGAATKLFNTCKENNLQVDILVNNAGVGIFGEHIDLSPELLENMIMLNVTNVTLLCRLFGNAMKEKGSGYILNIASTAAYQPVPKFACYAATKSYVLNFSEALTKELEDYGVSVSCLSPGQTDTAFFTQAGINDSESGLFSPKGRMTAEEVATIGIDMLFKKKISTIAGLKNKLMAFSNRFAPRAVVAEISKRLTATP